MRAVIAASLLVLSLGHASAASYLVVCTAACPASDGTTQPAGTALNRIVADPSFHPGAGLSLVPDDGRALYAPAPHPTIISAIAFLQRFTAAEQAAVQADAVAHPATIGVGLTTGMTAGQIDLTSVATKSWMDLLVQDGDITAARETAILKP